MPTRRELTDFVVESEKRTLKLFAQFAAIQVFLRMDLPVLLMNVYCKSSPGEMTDARWNDLREFVHRTRAKIESDLDTRMVEVMSHDEGADIRDRIDLFERLLLNSEDEDSGKDKS